MRLWGIELLAAALVAGVAAPVPALGQDVPVDSGLRTGEAPSKVVPGSRRLVVGTKPAPPFAIRNDDGTWSGISIDLWRDIAHDMGLRYEIKPFDTLKALLEASENGTVDLGVAATTITAERESKFDFSHPFFFTGLGIATPPPSDSGGISSVIANLISLRLLGFVGGLLALLLGLGLLIWLLERKANPEQFEHGPMGILDGLWWSAVTMTTVGYGDISPRTWGGRVLALIWMFAAIIIISFFTAGIASSLTVSRLESTVQGPGDLPRVRVGTVNGTSAARYLQSELGVFPVLFKDVSEGLAATAAGRVDAFVYDHPILRYVARRELPGEVEVLDVTFNAQTYGISLPTGSAFREQLNSGLLKFQTNEAYWYDLQKKYLGE